MSIPPDPVRRPGKLWLYTEPIRWQYTDLQPLSLWQLMDYFSSHDFMKAIRDVYGYEMELKPRVEETGDWRTEITDFDKNQANDLLDRTLKSFPSKDFPQTSAAMTRVYAFANSWCHFQDLYIRIVGLRETMEDELRGRKLVLVPGLKAEYCDKEDLFGQSVCDAFPSTLADITECGNAFAVGLNTACVFHSMRVLEKGLKALANAVGASYTSDNWGRIIDRIETKITEMGKLPKDQNPDKLVNLQFYSEAAKEFRYFKDAWRNHVSHSSVTYDEAKALKISNHVRDFMQHLSLRLSDSTTV